jgi:hypothetical protein
MRCLVREPLVQSALEKVPGEYKAACYAKRQKHDGVTLRTKLRFLRFQGSRPSCGSRKNTRARFPASWRSTGDDQHIAFRRKSGNKIRNQPDDWWNEQHDQQLCHGRPLKKRNSILPPAPCAGTRQRLIFNGGFA